MDERVENVRVRSFPCGVWGARNGVCQTRAGGDSWMVPGKKIKSRRLFTGNRSSVSVKVGDDGTVLSTPRH